MQEQCSFDGGNEKVFSIPQRVYRLCYQPEQVFLIDHFSVMKALLIKGGKMDRFAAERAECNMIRATDSKKWKMFRKTALEKFY